MPLPNAKPDPAGSNVYRQLNSIKLGDLTNEQFDIVYQNVFLNDMSEDELRRLALVGAARQSFSASSSGPIPNTGEVLTIAATTTNIYELLVPGPGEVYQLTGGSISGTGLSGNVCHHLMTANVSDSIDGGSDRTKAVLNVEYCSTAGQAVLNETTPFGQIFLDENIALYGQSTGTFTEIKYKISVVRIR